MSQTIGLKATDLLIQPLNNVAGSEAGCHLAHPITTFGLLPLAEVCPSGAYDTPSQPIYRLRVLSRYHFVHP